MFGSLFIPRLADLYGRKWPFYSTVVLSIPIYFGVIFSTNLNLTISLFFLWGVACCGKFQVNYVYIAEMMPIKYRTHAGSLT
jgi:MFS family permease